MSLIFSPLFNSSLEEAKFSNWKDAINLCSEHNPNSISYRGRFSGKKCWFLWISYRVDFLQWSNEMFTVPRESIVFSSAKVPGTLIALFMHTKTRRKCATWKFLKNEKLFLGYYTKYRVLPGSKKYFLNIFLW